MTRRKMVKIISVIFLFLLALFVCLLIFGERAYAAGLLDDEISSSNLYSRYPFKHYDLDYYVDNSWGWLPWNWGRSLGNAVISVLYHLANLIWFLSRVISNATGYIVQEAYKIDIISDLSAGLGRNMQILAGIDESGIHAGGFYYGFLLFFILIIGIYVTYFGVIKREATKAVGAVINFVVVFIMSSVLIAYAPTFIDAINQFSIDINTSVLDIGTKMVVPDAEFEGEDSVDKVRNNLFYVQVYVPWVVLQYGTGDIASIGEERIEALLSSHPNSDLRRDIVVYETEEHRNTNMTITGVLDRLGTAIFIFIINIFVSTFVCILAGMMVFSQILFFMYAIFLVISFLLSTLPMYSSLRSKAIEQVFNSIIMRSGITLIVTVALSLSILLYNLTSSSPFIIVGVLQIILFVGMYIKLNDFLSMMGIKVDNTSTQVSRRIMSNGRRVSRTVKRTKRNIGRVFKGVGRTVRRVSGSSSSNDFREASGSNSSGSYGNVNRNNRRSNTRNYRHEDNVSDLRNGIEELNSSSISGKVKRTNDSDGRIKAGVNVLNKNKMVKNKNNHIKKIKNIQGKRIALGQVKKGTQPIKSTQFLNLQIKNNMNKKQVTLLNGKPIRNREDNQSKIRSNRRQNKGTDRSIK